MRPARIPALTAALILVAACSSTYKSKPQMNYYHGQNVPAGYITIVRATTAEIEFAIRVEFTQKQMYHLILDGNEPVAEGWFNTLRAGNQAYSVAMKPSEGRTFEVGKTYRLCIGMQNPEAVQMTSSNYPCIADHSFVFELKD